MSPYKFIQDVYKKKRRPHLWTFLMCAVVCIGFLATLLPEPAYAVRVSLKRVVFDKNTRSEILTIINNTGEQQTYRLGWRKYRMDNGKSLRAVRDDEDASDILWADKMIRFAPRRVTIPPGGSQQIRLLFRRPADLKEAEYRAHLWIVSEAKPEAFSTSDGDSEQSVKLAVQPAISLPIFVRNGELTAKASISNPKLVQKSGMLNASFTLNRTGTRSVYGDFDFVCADQGNDVVLHQVRGIAVYMETQSRNLDYDIPLSPQTATSCNSVNIIYRADPKDSDFKGKVLAQATASLQ